MFVYALGMRRKVHSNRGSFQRLWLGDEGSGLRGFCFVIYIYTHTHTHASVWFACLSHRVYCCSGCKTKSRSFSEIGLKIFHPPKKPLAGEWGAVRQECQNDSVKAD